MSGLARINREAAEELFSRFAPMFAGFVDVGILEGLAVEGGAGDAADGDSAPQGGLLSRLGRVLGGR